MAPRVVGAILAGGASRRMGRPKALLPVAGVPMAERVARAMRGAGARDLAMVGGAATDASSLDLGWVPDRWPGEGPLAGLAAAVMWGAEVGADVVVVAACDQPNLSADLLIDLVAGLTDPEAEIASVVGAAVNGSVVVTPDGRTHPFPAAWFPSVAAALERMVADGHRRADSAHSLGIATVEASSDSVIDVDRPDDLPAAERVVAHDGPPAGVAPPRNERPRPEP